MSPFDNSLCPLLSFLIMRLSFPRLVSFINIALLAALVVLSLVFVRDVISFALKKPLKESRSVEEADNQLKKQARRKLQDYAPILKNNVFGFPAGELKPLSSSSLSTPVEIANVDIKLSGTVSWASGFGYAVVLDTSGQQEVYKTGDYIPGAGYLRRVDKDRIIIEAGRESVEIPLAEITVLKEVGRAARVSKRHGKFRRFARKTSEHSYIVDQKAIESALENPKQIMTDARLLPNMVEGRQEGFVIKEIKPGGIYQSLGLKNGDVLLRVNEFDISDPETALQAFTALKGMDRVELDILRNGSKITLTYLIR